VITLALWIVYIFAMAGIGTLRDGELGPIRFPRWAEDTVWAVSEVARQPGELLVNAVWRLVGSRLYPDILPWIASERPRPIEFLVHLVLLPGMVVGTAGLIIGVAASGLEAWTRRSFPPPEPREDANR